MKKISLIVLIIIITQSAFAQTFKVDKTDFLIKSAAWGVLSLSNNYFDRQIISKPTQQELEALSTNNLWSFDKIALVDYSKKLKDYSDYTALGTLGTVIYLTYDDPNLLDNIMVFLEILLAQDAVGKWTKTLTSRYRPFVYNENVSLNTKQQRNSQHSFYSLHSSTVFSAATFGYYYHYQNNGHSIPYAILLYGTATATAALRVASAQHFPSDVMAGAIAGSAISYFICKFYDNDRFNIDLTSNTLKFGVRF